MESDELNQAFISYLNCPCELIREKDLSKITKTWTAAWQQGQKEGFTPVIIVPDATFWENIKFNTSPDDRESALFEINADDVDTYRKSMLSESLEDGHKLLHQATSDRVAEYIEEYHEPLPLGSMDEDEGDALDELMWVDEAVPDLILAKIPVKNPWEVFAYIPFGNWNECPDTPELMSISKYWFERFQAVPALISADTLNFYVAEPVRSEQALELATEQFAICADIVEQGTETISALADSLSQSHVWFFWWD